MGCNKGFKVLSHLLKHGTYQVKAQELSHYAPTPCKANLFVHNDLYLPCPKFAICFRSSVLLSHSPGFPAIIWKYHGINLVWNSPQQTVQMANDCPTSKCAS